MSYSEEFKTVDLILESDSVTKYIDSFCLSLIKSEKQVRKIFTYLIFQHPNLTKSDIVELRKALADNKGVYFRHFILGINNIYAKPFAEIYGENFDSDFTFINDEFKKIRDKVFHGQITEEGKDEKDLSDAIEKIREWSLQVNNNFQNEIGFGGFERNSFQKRGEAYKDIENINLDKYGTISNYSSLLSDIITQAKKISKNRQLS